MARDRDRGDLSSGALDPMIALWLRLKPMHGYSLAKHIKQAWDNLLRIEEGSLDPALQRLLREGLLESEAGCSAKGRPTRIYQLTTACLQRKHEASIFEKVSPGITRVLAVARCQEG